MVNFNAICNDFFDADDYEYVFFFRSSHSHQLSRAYHTYFVNINYTLM